ncbi:unnamed protein product [Rhizophagus irregularis]|nr:unnamed protein product [Rhizophagus irregularis]
MVDQDFIIQKLIDVIYYMLMRARSNMKEFVIFLDHGSYDLPDISNFTTYSSGIANLKYLEVEIMFKLWMLQTNKEIITPILDIIKSQPINNMSIHYTPTYEYLEEIIIYISKFRSKTLTRFDLLRYFEYFTNNCKANLKKLSINLYSGNPLRKNFLKCIDNYQRVHNSLKILEFKQYEINWSNEEREIVKSLENQGICLRRLNY